MKPNESLHTGIYSLAIFIPSALIKGGTNLSVHIMKFSAKNLTVSGITVLLTAAAFLTDNMLLFAALFFVILAGSGIKPVITDDDLIQTE